MNELIINIMCKLWGQIKVAAWETLEPFKAPESTVSTVRPRALPPVSTYSFNTFRNKRMNVLFIHAFIIICQIRHVSRNKALQTSGKYCPDQK